MVKSPAERRNARSRVIGIVTQRALIGERRVHENAGRVSICAPC
jgi:hypothetical protein